MNGFLEFLSPFVCEFLHKQYVLADINFYTITKGNILHTWNVQANTDTCSTTDPRQYMVNSVEGDCNCVFMRTMMMPCRHVMVVRKHLEKRHVISKKQLQPAGTFRS